MNRIYTDEEEDRIRLHDRVREWTQAGLLDAEQAAAIDARLVTGLKRTNASLRGVLGFFTVIVAFAAAALVAKLVDATTGPEGAAVCAVTAVACVAASGYLARSLRLYRYGVEEMLAVCAVLMAAFAMFLALRPSVRVQSGPDWRTLAAFATCAVGGWLVYVRFGLVYAAAGGSVFAGLIPFRLGLSDISERSVAACVFVVLAVAIDARRRAHADGFRADEYASIEIAPIAGAYFALNLRVGDVAGVPVLADVPRWFYWTTYAAVWAVPLAVLCVAVRGKVRPLLSLGAVLALGTLATNKPYLGVPRETWDPMLLGAILIGVVFALRRWIDAGAGRQRAGYVATPILVSDRELLTALANASVLWHAAAVPAPTAGAPSPAGFEGGRSGGGGGGATY